MQVKYKEQIFHLQQIAVQRRIKDTGDKTRDICVSINDKNTKVMAIEIKYSGGVYEIKGLLNSQNSDSLTNHFETLMKHTKGVVITLEKVLDIDNYAVKKITELYHKAVSGDQLFYIIGRENARVNHQFTALNSDEILL